MRAREPAQCCVSLEGMMLLSKSNSIIVCGLLLGMAVSVVKWVALPDSYGLKTNLLISSSNLHEVLAIPPSTQSGALLAPTEDMKLECVIDQQLSVWGLVLPLMSRKLDRQPYSVLLKASTNLKNTCRG